MLKYYVRQTPEESLQSLPGYREQDGLWVHGEIPEVAELITLHKQYGLDSNILRDVLDKDELPRLEVNNGDLYVFLRSIWRTKHGQVESAPVLSVLTPRVFISLSHSAALSQHKIAEAAHGTPTGERGALFLATMTAIITDYEESIVRTARYIKDIGHRLRTHEVNNNDFIHFVTVEDNLGVYSLNLTNMMTVAERLKDAKVAHLSDRDIESIDDIILHIRQLLTSVQSHAKTVESIRNAYTTIANNKLNERIKRLTVLTVLITLPNVFFGMYGMNIVLPLQDEPWAYTGIIGFTVLIILVVYILAKRFRLF